MNRTPYWLSLALSLAFTAPSAADELPALEQQAFKAAARAVEESVVQIQTVGGLDRAEDQPLAQGATTGLVLTADGYIVSSAINFAQQPSSVLVRLPDGDNVPARVIGRDSSRMLVLLKVKADDELKPASAASLADVRVGDWTIAVGRTYSADEVNISVGVVSALSRMHGRAIQTDANVSAANYGGPLVDIHGRTLAVLVPMAPQSPGGGEVSETAGAEFYDSGIGFAVPLEHIVSVLDRWIDERDLKSGVLGVGLASGSPHVTPAKISAVWPGSPAEKAGWRVDDEVVAVDGDPIASQTQLRFKVIPRYAGDRLDVTIRRGTAEDAEEIETQIELAGELPPFRHSFLGVLPVRESPEVQNQATAKESPARPDESEDEQRHGERDEHDDSNRGIMVRAVWPGSPAEDAKLESGDRIVTLADEPVNTIDDALKALNSKLPGSRISLLIDRGGEQLERRVTLAELPSDVLSSSELRGGAKDAGEDPDLSVEDLKLPEFKQSARFLRPASGGSTGLLVWLGSGNPADIESALAPWRTAATRRDLTVLVPTPGEPTGWSVDDREYLARLLATAVTRFNVDPHRIVVGGEGRGGQLAYALAFKSRRWVRGVAVVDAAMPRTLEVPANSPSDRIAMLSIGSPNATTAALARRDLANLEKAGFPISREERRASTNSPASVDSATASLIGRWIDGLHRF